MSIPRAFFFLLLVSLITSVPTNEARKSLTTANSSSRLDPKVEIAKMNLMCAHPKNTTTTKCLALGRMLTDIMFAGNDLRSVYGAKASDLGNCAEDSSSCGCGWTLWAECAVDIGSCSSVCVASWGSDCLQCLLDLSGCQPCACYYACKYDSTGSIPSEICPTQYANC
eukprot:c15681_g2_i1.p1 GENE.c15681_g2_i1~~c15681_g2_i1.p1  ORF type:complete len:168 (+),score=52.93 c15681_g2_i1:42-545(+)